MKIAIDARWIFDEISGIGSYTFNIIRTLVKPPKNHSYVLIFDDESRKETIMSQLEFDDDSQVQAVVLSYGVFSIRNQLLLGHFLRNNHVDIYHSTNYMMPLFSKPCTYVVTIHDIIPLKHPEFTPKAKKTRFFGLYKWIMKRVVKRADSVLADSEYSRQDIISYFAIDPLKVCTVFPGLDEDFLSEKHLTGQKDFKRNYRIKGKLVIYVGRQDPYKNVLGLVRAFRRFLAEEKVDAKLLIVGPEDLRYVDVHRFIKQYKLQDKIIFSGYLEKRDLIALYRQADLLVLPSRYEGFGLPVIEAFASRTPVIAADTSSLPEVVGEAGLLISPDDGIGLAAAMKRILTDESLADELVRKGSERVATFSWEKSAQEVLGVYSNIIEKQK